MAKGKNCCFFLTDEAIYILEQAKWILQRSKNQILSDLITGPLAAKLRQTAATPVVSPSNATPKQ